MSAESMFSGRDLLGRRDGDLPPGVYERLPDGRLVPTTKILTNDPPRPLHVNRAGKITDVTHDQIEYLRDVVRMHYEKQAGRSLSFNSKFADNAERLVDRAADSVIRSNL